MTAEKFAETGWFEIFKAKDYGKDGNYSTDDLRDMANIVNSGEHVVPIVIGHGADKDWSKPLPSELADGALKAAKIEGEKLFAKANVSERVKHYWDDNRLHSWSAGIYKNFQGKGKKALRHLAALGKTPPKIKGLNYKPQFTFSEDEQNGEFIEITFSETTNGDNDLPTGAHDMSKEAELQAEVDRLNAELAKVDQAKFDELEKDRDEKVIDLDKVRKERDDAKKRAEKAEADLKDNEEKSAFAEIDKGWEEEIKKGVPKTVEEDYRIFRAFELGLKNEDGHVTFAEGKTSEKSAGDAFKAFREAKRVPIEEEGTQADTKMDFSTFSEDDVEKAKTKRIELTDKKLEEMKKTNEGATFAEASQWVMNKHPELYPDMVD